ncbi:DUF2019 domain-containing protein [Myroides odoratus]|uniref:DUF2019 domain-containing protein n=1 Tax=Myroides odoratus TaxID=256 RepID=UPI00333F6171
MTIKDIKIALEIFEEACVKHAEATENGDYKTANKYYTKIVKVAKFLKEENAITDLKNYLSSPFVGVRLWAGYYWLTINEQEGIKVLKEIVNSPTIHSLTAETTLSEWKKGNLKIW